MTSFAKHIAVLAAALIATTALGDRSDDANKAGTPDPKGKTDSKDSGAKKKKKNKKPEGTPSPDGPRKVDIPVIKDHPSYGLSIPYFDGTGKRQMNFKIGVATRIDDDHVEMKDMTIETFNEQGEHDMQIDLPLSVFDNNKSAITTQTHVTINRADFVLSGDSMIFYTRSQQGGLAGNVHMTIFNLKEEASGNEADAEKAREKEPKTVTKVDKSLYEPDTFKTSQGRRQSAPSSSLSTEKPDKFYTPSAK
ncbi:hypothetical protein CfE428DRAFT_4259 [Chthoniobacter flavus Ellin428]|uniref:Uncharacterized protein n=1 Tax=Chthoniobacter flavus Ellin428 TaxID=497964 RepID=B4D5S0_9BACT|nr:hypothetical protein [Chthoniobacter flavus]EDY18123.1 hypothetical protein CfE428DRAFT_4259 [Chthoniobacter flavus Ellin428]TCO91520.1 hypothetical protein EV701_108248 [Chthoniobacter flavus]